MLTYGAASSCTPLDFTSLRTGVLVERLRSKLTQLPTRNDGILPAAAFWRRVISCVPGSTKARRSVEFDVQKWKTTPPPTKILCCRLLPVFTFRSGIPDQKSRASPRRLNLPMIFTSSPTPACTTPVVVPFLRGFGPPNSRVDLSPKWLPRSISPTNKQCALAIRPYAC